MRAGRMQASVERLHEPLSLSVPPVKRRDQDRLRTVLNCLAIFGPAEA